MELEDKLKLLEKQRSFLEQQAFVVDKKAIIFDFMIDIAEQEYQIHIRKNHHVLKTGGFIIFFRLESIE
jgi:transposase